MNDESPLAVEVDVDALLNEMWREVQQLEARPDLSYRDLPATRRIMTAPAAVQREALLHALQHDPQAEVEPWMYVTILGNMAHALLRRDLEWTDESMVRLITTTVGLHGSGMVELATVVDLADRLCKGRSRPLDPQGDLARALAGVRSFLRSAVSNATRRKLIAQLDAILGPEDESALLPIHEGDAWTDAALEELRAMPDEERAKWHGLLRHCATALSSKPARKWLKEAEHLIAEVGRDAFVARCCAWLAYVGKPGTRAAHWREPMMLPSSEPTVLNPVNADVLKGLVWCGAVVQEQPLLEAIAHAAEACFKKVANVGPRCPKVGNACLHALSAAADEGAVSALVRLVGKSKHSSVKKQVDGAIRRAADRRGEMPEDLIEIAVPTFGLAGGCIAHNIGTATAEVRIIGTVDVEVRWTHDGKSVKAAPKHLRDANSTEVKAVAKLKKDIETALRTQRQRIERLLTMDRTWPLDEWRRRYVDHPLVGDMSRRLVWEFSRGDRTAETSARQDCFRGMVIDDRILGLEGSELAVATQDATVSLWHPIRSDADEVRQWREFLAARQIVQPFRQAHREIYILTDAERESRVYSNRFAAHLLRQHQLAALCAERGWTCKLQGMGFDGGSCPMLELPGLGLVAHYETSVVEDADAHSGAGIGLYVSTDAVRFRRGPWGDEVALEEIPPLVFSEVMRDVDLFVGVCSIGRDPEWPMRAGTPEAHEEYTRRFGMGELSQMGAMRREVLLGILPRLKMSQVCTVEERFLRVRGKLCEYRIHLGSGTIIMEPGGQFLCIVPGARSSAVDRGTVYLPFEGDQMLSIILSKAMMLAEDDKIKDPSILSQIARRY